MESKSVFPLYAWILSGLLLVSSFYLPPHFDIPYPAPLGPVFDPQRKPEHLEYIQEHHPEIVLIGDSTLFLGVDQGQLTAELGRETYSIAIPGSGSAVWYLLMKNTIAESAYTPRVVVILFHDTLLTLPAFRTTGLYFDIVDDYSRRNEPVLLERAYLDQMNPVEKAAQQYFPLFSARREMREGLDRRLRYSAPALLKCPQNCVDEAINSVFGKQRLNPEALSQAIDAAQQSMYTPKVMDFDRQVDRSFLPEMIRIATENNIQLVFVRIKTLTFPTVATEPAALRAYMTALEVYVLRNHALYVDFSHDERIKDEYFFDDLHLGAEGKEVFTHLLAEELRSLPDYP